LHQPPNDLRERRCACQCGCGKLLEGAGVHVCGEEEIQDRGYPNPGRGYLQPVSLAIG
jgi:hypothetical protein